MTVVKLNIHNEVDLVGQVQQYCQLTKVDLGHGRVITNPAKEMYNNIVLIIDTEGMYLYVNGTEEIGELLSLDQLKVTNDISKLKELLYMHLICLKEKKAGSGL